MYEYIDVKLVGGGGAHVWPLLQVPLPAEDPPPHYLPTPVSAITALWFSLLLRNNIKTKSIDNVTN